MRSESTKTTQPYCCMHDDAIAKEQVCIADVVRCMIGKIFNRKDLYEHDSKIIWVLRNVSMALAIPSRTDTARTFIYLRTRPLSKACRTSEDNARVQSGPILVVVTSGQDDICK